MQAVSPDAWMFIVPFVLFLIGRGRGTICPGLSHVASRRGGMGRGWVASVEYAARSHNPKDYLDGSCNWGPGRCRDCSANCNRPDLVGSFIKKRTDDPGGAIGRTIAASTRAPIARAIQVVLRIMRARRVLNEAPTARPIPPLRLATWDRPGPYSTSTSSDHEQHERDNEHPSKRRYACHRGWTNR